MFSGQVLALSGTQTLKKAPLVQELMRGIVGTLSMHLAWQSAEFKTTNFELFKLFHSYTSVCFIYLDHIQVMHYRHNIKKYGKLWKIEVKIFR